MRWKKNILLIVLVNLMMFIIYGVSVKAETLPPGFLVGDDTGFKAGNDGEYFLSDQDIFPGKKFSRKISVSNYSNVSGSYALKLVMNPEDNEKKAETLGKVDLLKNINVKMTYRGKTIYEGTIDGNGIPVANEKGHPIDLGVLEVGQAEVINADFEVSNQTNEDDWKKVNSTTFYWLFYANRADKEDPSNEDKQKEKPAGKLPQTGELILKICILLGVIILLLVILIFRKKRLSR
ncbi:LPXTG cell wall anchor domain-containing protein [Vagococcus sp. JNUCC 83]